MDRNGYDNDLVASLKKLYATSPPARDWLDHAAGRKRDAQASSIERLMAVCDVGRADAVSLARQFDEIACADFKVGRRGQKSRLEWRYSLTSLGKAASGETESLDQIDRDADEMEDDDAAESSEADQSPPSPQSAARLVLKAKEALSRDLGIPMGSIEIIIRA